ncbi:MAG: tripartite tricarboxylate transporter substrate binding protein, partial [Comamonadaceae bacterium]
MNKRQLLTFVCAGLTLAASPWASAQNAQTVRLVVPYGAGGPIDITARALAERVRDTLGGPV